MTQGWLVFPQKNESLELEGLTTAVDSMLIQVKFDNTLLSNSLARAFDEVGTHRYRTDSTMTAYYHIRQSGYFNPCYPYFRIPNLPGACLHSQSYCRTRCPHTGLLSACQRRGVQTVEKVCGSTSKLIVDYKYEAVKRKSSEGGYLRLSRRLPAGRCRRIYRTHKDGQPERTGICLNPP